MTHTQPDTHGTAPSQLAKATSVGLSVEVAETILYADDGPSEIIKELKSGTLTLGVDDIGAQAAAVITGAHLDTTGSSSPPPKTPPRLWRLDSAPPRPNGKYKYL